MESVRHIDDPNYRCVLFRRTTKDIDLPGGMWDEAFPIYSALGGIPAYRKWRFPSGARIEFSHMQHEKDAERWKGSQATLFIYDQLEEFTEKMFWYIVLSRGRSKAKASSYARASCNPDPNSFVAKIIEWWIDPNSGYAIPERSGVIRWFLRINDVMTWFSSKEEALNHVETMGVEKDAFQPISFTFIASNINDNPIGMALNPGYKAALNALAYVDMERLLHGNWKIQEMAGNVFRRSYFEIVDTYPKGAYKIRYWDRAATVKSKKSPDPDYTVGLLLGHLDGVYYVIHVERFRGTPYDVEMAIKNLAEQDGLNTVAMLEIDPGQAGKVEQAYYEKVFEKYNRWFSDFARTGNKVVRSKGVSAASQHGRIKVVRGEWNEEFFNELENFPDGKHDDQVDCFSGAFYEMNNHIV